MSTGNSLLAFLAGAAAGAAIALILTPDSEEKTGEKKRKGASDVADKVKEKILEKKQL